MGTTYNENREIKELIKANSNCICVNPFAEHCEVLKIAMPSPFSTQALSADLLSKSWNVLQCIHQMVNSFHIISAGAGFTVLFSPLAEELFLPTVIKYIFKIREGESNRSLLADPMMVVLGEGETSPDACLHIALLPGAAQVTYGWLQLGLPCNKRTFLGSPTKKSIYLPKKPSR